MSFVGTTLFSTDYRAQEPNNSLQESHSGSRWQWIESDGKRVKSGEPDPSNRVIRRLARDALGCVRLPPKSRLAEKASAGLAAGCPFGYAAGRTDPTRQCLSLRSAQQAYRIEDAESKRRSLAAAASGVIVSGTAILSIADIATLLSISSLRVSENVLSGLSCFIGMGIFGLNSYRCFSFRSELAKILEDQNLAERERLAKAIEFLKKQVALTKQEREAALKDPYGGVRNLSCGRREFLQQEKLIDLTAAKIRSFKRRSSQKAAELIIEKGGPILERLRKDPGAGQISKARLFVQEAQRENTKRMLLNALGAVLSGLTCAILISWIILDVGVSSLALFTILTVASIAMIAYSIFAHLKDIRNDRDLAARSVSITEIAKTA